MKYGQGNERGCIMELHEIRYYLALSQTLNFTRAAEVCNVTQPALTRAIKSLEDKLGGTLIHRERGNTHLTELGRLMLPYFSEMFGHMEEAKRRAEGFVKLTESRLTVGLMCTIGPANLIDLISDFKDEHQGVELYIKDGTARHLEDLLTQGQIDVAIYCSPDAPNEALHMLPLFDERFMIAVAQGHPLAHLKQVTIPDLEGHNYLSRVNCEYLGYIRDIRESMGVEIRRIYASERDDWIQCMVAAGLGFSIVPEFSVTIPGLVSMPLVDPEFRREINLVTVRGRPHSPAVGAFVHACRRHPWSETLGQFPRRKTLH